ncbi:hypothetical protein ACO0QE_000458 [Hanseniaspora vineae]
MPLTRLNTSIDETSEASYYTNDILGNIVRHINENGLTDEDITSNSSNTSNTSKTSALRTTSPTEMSVPQSFTNDNIIDQKDKENYIPKGLNDTENKHLDVYFSIVDRKPNDVTFQSRNHRSKGIFQMTKVLHIQTPNQTIESFNKNTVTKLLLDVISRASACNNTSSTQDYNSKVPVVPNYVTGVRLDPWKDILLQDISTTSSACPSGNSTNTSLTFHGETKCPLMHLLNNSDSLESIVSRYSISKVNPLIVLLTNNPLFEQIVQRDGTLMLPNLRTLNPHIPSLGSVKSMHRVKTPTSTTYMNISSNISRSGTPTKREYSTLLKKTEEEAVVANNYMSMFPEITVLIVEDNIINRSILSGVLRKHKIKYKLAKNGKEAVDTWCKGGIHLIFMDLQLPVMTGIEAARKIRHLEKVNGITGRASEVGEESHEEEESQWTLEREKFKSPVIIVALTASNSQQDKENALTSGCNDYLTKPVNLVWLSNKLGEWGCMQALIVSSNEANIDKANTNKANTNKVSKYQTTILPAAHPFSQPFPTLLMDSFIKYKAFELKQEYEFILKDSNGVPQDTVRLIHWLKKIISNFAMSNHLEMSHLYLEVYDIWRFHSNGESVSKKHTHNKNHHQVIMGICHHYLQLMTSPQVIKLDIIDAVVDQTRSNLDHALAENDTALFEQSFKLCLQLNNIPGFLHEAERILESIIFTENVQKNEFGFRICTESLVLLPSVLKRNPQVFSTLWKNFTKKDLSPTQRIVSLNTLYQLSKNGVKLEYMDVIEIFELLELVNEWDKSVVLASLPISFVPSTHAQVYKLINLSMRQLSSFNTSNVMNSLKFIMYLLNYVDEIDLSEVKNLSNGIVSLLNKPNELKFLVLRNVILLLLSRQPAFFQGKVDISYFFIEIDDPIYIKDTKLEILYLMANEQNISIILDELKEYCMDTDVSMSRKAVRAIGNLAIKLQNEIGVRESVQHLLELLDFFANNDYIIQEILSVFKNIFRKYPQYGTSKIINQLIQNIDNIDENESRSSMIWFLTNYAQYNPSKYFDILTKHYYLNFQAFDLQPFDVKCSILNSVMKFFINTTQNKKTSLDSNRVLHVCNTVLQNCVDNVANPDIRDKALLYQRLLSTLSGAAGITLTLEDVSKIVDCDLPLITLNDQLDPVTLENLELEIGSTASIYLKPVEQIFRTDKPKFLPNSEILHRDKRALQITGSSHPPESFPHELHNGKSRTSSLFDSPFNESPTETRFSNGNRSRSSSASGAGKNLSDFDKPATKVTTVKRKKTLVRKPSMLSKTFNLKH